MRHAAVEPQDQLSRADAATIMLVSFVLSRVLGVLRNVVIADVFGNSRQVEAYFAAFRIPDTMFTLVSGGVLASAFVPVFAGLLGRAEDTGRREWVDQAWEVASTVLTTIAVVLVVLGILGEIFAGPIMDLLVGGYTPSQRALTVDLTRIMLLQPIFLGVAGVLTPILQSYNRWILVGIAPLVYTVPVIVAALLFGGSQGVAVLAWAVVFGAVLQLVVQIPGLVPESRLRIMADWRLPGSRTVIRLMGPRIIGLAAFQGMLFITLFLAAGLPAGMVGAINYSWPLMWFPVSAIGTAVGTAIFPDLSRLFEQEQFEEIRRIAFRSLSMVLFLALPAAAGLIVLRRPIVNLLYNHGGWTSTATEQTAFALLFYAMALAPLAAIEVLPRFFYAMHDTKTPVRIAVVAVALDAVLSVLFVHMLPRGSGQGGLALATTVATAFQAIWLTRNLERKLGDIRRGSVLRTLWNTAVASLVMAMALYVVLDLLTTVFAQHGWGALVTVVFEMCLGLGVFVFVAYVLGIPELWETRALLERLWKRIGGALKRSPVQSGSV